MVTNTDIHSSLYHFTSYLCAVKSVQNMTGAILYAANWYVGKQNHTPLTGNRTPRHQTLESMIIVTEEVQSLILV